MDFNHRYVGFGTAFASAPGSRQTTAHTPEDEARLYENELVVDVGGVCWGYAGETLAVLDHHFHRLEGNQFPSAAAAVLHNAQRLFDRFTDATAPLWLVTHREPDFDALCALFLARRILEGKLPAGGWEDCGLRPDGWGRTRSEIDWRKPRLPADPDRRAALLLAAFASAVDNGWRIVCPRERALHSVLYTGLYVTERPWLGDGAQEFFTAITQALQGGLNPLLDSVLEGHPAFARELRLLDREKDAYARDLLRARKTVVHLATCERPFQDCFHKVKQEPLLDRDLKLLPPHRPDPAQPRAQADGLFLRDPESLLFKEWARQDLENSPLGRGFLFTAVAWSGQRPGSPLNQTDYYFALDPEKAGHRHLYDVWATLQQAEIQALHQERWAEVRRKLEDAEIQASHTHQRTTCRPGFEGRAAALACLFHDPWFDGANYQGTLVVTPNAGTLIGPAGTRGDLTDDPVAELVRRRLEFSFFTSPVAIHDFASSAPRKEHAPLTVHLEQMQSGQAPLPPACAGCYRFGAVEIAPDANLDHGPLPEQIGRLLWRLLNPDDRDGVPTDFLERHLIVHPQWVGVWSRRGLVLAHKPSARQTADQFRSLLSRLAALAAAVEALVAEAPKPDGHAPNRRKAEDLIRDVARLKHQLALPESRLPARFFDATGMDRVLELLRDIQATENLATITHVQKVAEYVEVFLVAAYSVYLINYLGHNFHFADHYVGWSILVGSVVAALLTALLPRVRTGRKHPRARLVLVILTLAALVGGYLAIGQTWFKPEPPAAPLRTSDFGFLSPFVIRHSSLTPHELPL